MDKNKNKKRGSSKIATPQQPPILAEIGVPLKEYVEGEVKEMKQSVSKSTTDKLSKLRGDLTKVKVKFYLERLPDEKDEDYFARMPHPAHDGDIGMDVVATSVEYDADFDRYIYHTGFYTESTRGIGCKIMPRSSNTKTEAYLGNGIGLVDVCTYRGEYLVVFKNRDSIGTIAKITALQIWNDLPWYKRMFKNYRAFEREIIDDVIKDGPWFAPYKVGDKIGQLVFEKFPEIEIEFLQSKDELSKTERGEGGFGSTGK